MQVIIDGLHIGYSQIGSGKKTILFLHGWTPNAQQSFRFLASELASDFRCILPDQPGFGSSSPPPSNWGVGEYALFIKKFVSKINFRPDVVIAHSNGGTLAINAVSQELLMPSKLVLLGCAGVREKTKAKKTVLKVVAKPVKFVLMPMPKTTQARVKKYVYGKLGSDMYVMENMKPIFKRIVSYDALDDANKVKIPTLLIYGLNDTSTPPSFGKLFQETISGSRLELVEGAGHYVHTDKPEEVIKLINDFII